MVQVTYYMDDFWATFYVIRTTYQKIMLSTKVFSLYLSAPPFQVQNPRGFMPRFWMACSSIHLT